MSEITTWLVLLGVVLTAASAHVLLKIGMDQVGMIGLSHMRDPWELGDLVTSVLTTPALLGDATVQIPGRRSFDTRS
jgi:hypothetical protein